MAKNAYSYYIKGDITQEAISTITCPTEEQAIEIFCNKKQLSKEDFLELFEITYENGNNKEGI